MTRRADILRAILSQLRTITKANGFTTDIGLQALYSQDLPMQYDGPPTCTLYDSEERTTEVGSQHDKRLECRIDAITHIETDPIDDGCNALADIIRVIGANRKWGGLAVGTYLSDNQKEIETAGTRAIRISQEFVVQYRVSPFET